MNDQIVFLALTVWREARGESIECQKTVAMTIMQRLTRPKRFGNNVMEVVFKKRQFSSLTDPKDLQLTIWPECGSVSWLLALRIAEDAFHKDLAHPAPGADHYYDISIPEPKWAKSGEFIKQIGKVRFYRVP